MIKKTLHIKEDFIRSIYDNIAKKYDYHRMHMLNPWNLVEWPYIKKQLNNLKNKNILDAGCGTGIFIKKTIFLNPEIKEIVGLDISEKMLEIAKSRCKSDKIKFLRQTIRKIPFKNGYFDIIFALEVLHYIKEIGEVLNEFNRVLKKNKKLVISVKHPVRNLSYMSKIGINSYFNRGWYGEKWPGTGGTELYNFYRPLDEWINSLTKAGFNIKMMIESKPSEKIKIKHPDFYCKYIRIPRGLILIAVKK